ncbi:HAMP domain-containing sensor histidine kinase [Puia sp.]|jgi:signal transduction histidine kinase|uniref:HAMP domain-containing sensor histidine kinase n=1 Tax=Puia sp. TaxID=2045100 RepID=UPI002F4281B1
MGIKLKITLAFSVVFILLSLLFNLAGYRRIRDMLIGDSKLRVAYVQGTKESLSAERMVAASDEQLQANMRTLRSLLVVSSILSVMVSGLVSYILARILLLPLQRIIQAARNINTNKMRDPIPVNGTRDELHDLSVTINDMMHRIDESLQQQQNFFGSASHELKTPLAILRTELEVGLRKPGLEEGVRHLLSNQLEEISRLQEVVNEFLVVSQLRVGSPSLYRRPFDLSVLVVKVYNQLLPLLRQKNLEPVIRFDEEAADFIVTADEDKIRIVLLNLVENAAKYGVRDTAITCKVGRVTMSGELTVEFTNITGTEKVNTENLQVAFYRSDLIQRGAGLGLWLCNEIIRLHGGRIEVSSGNHRFSVRISLPMPEAVTREAALSA